MGRRWGKTTLAVNRIAGPALEGFPVGWFAPNYKYLTEAWTDIARHLQPVITSKNSQSRRMELVTGGVLEFWSLEDPDSGRSRKYKHVVVDEASKARHLKYAYTHAIRATLADFKGTIDFLSTPKGHDFFWELHCRGGAEPGWASWTMPTWSNPFIDRAEVEDLRKGLPERVFQQEIEAKFLEDAGGVFRKVRAAVDEGRSKAGPPEAGQHYSLGVDLARIEDFTVIAVLNSAGRQVYHERFNQISWERQIGAIKAVAERYRGTCYLDSTGVGDPLYEALRRAGVRVKGYTFTNASKEALVDHLALQIEQGKLRLMDVPEQTNELLAYQYELTPSRNVRMNAPEGMHDDCVIALALAAWGIGHRNVIKVY
jgi:hypothetical protein